MSFRERNMKPKFYFVDQCENPISNMIDGFDVTEWFRKAKIEWTISLDNEGTEQNFARRCDWA